MWVKTQDKKILANCDDFNIITIKIKKKVGYVVQCGKTQSNGCYSAALYSSMKKALKVLELIEAYIFSQERGNVRRPFQFPQDEEVQV